MSSIDWAKLVAQGRAKAYGVSWTEEEAKAVFHLKIPADYVRKGILTLEDYEKAKTNPAAAPAKTKEELMAEAKKEGIAVTPEATKESLEKVIDDKKSAKRKEPAKKPAIKIKAKSAKKAAKR